MENLDRRVTLDSLQKHDVFTFGNVTFKIIRPAQGKRGDGIMVQCEIFEQGCYVYITNHALVVPLA